MAKGRKLSEEEQSLWNNFTQRIITSRKVVKEMVLKESPIVHKTRPSHKKQILLNVARSSKLSEPTSFIQHYKDIKKRQELAHHQCDDEFAVVGTRPSGLDNSTWKKFQKGQIQPEQILDLHGYTAQRAFFLLEDFLLKSHKHHIRCVEVITGIGSGSKDGGILKRELPYWLNRSLLKSLILATSYPTQWNGGAVRILLKRQR